MIEFIGKCGLNAYEENGGSLTSGKAIVQALAARPAAVHEHGRKEQKVIHSRFVRVILAQGPC